MIDRDINFNAKRFLLLTTLICVVFFVIVIKAFEYLPDNSNNEIPRTNKFVADNPVKTNVEKEIDNQETNEENIKDNEAKKDLNVNISADETVPELEGIEVPKQILDNQENSNPKLSSADTTENTIEQLFKNATVFKNKQEYVSAINEYKKIPEITQDKSIVAKSYEEIATVYGILKKYGTALAYAQKAYNLSPSSSREFLLARLYYKTGDTEKANHRIHNVLQRDFAQDR